MTVRYIKIKDGYYYEFSNYHVNSNIDFLFQENKELCLKIAKKDLASYPSAWDCDAISFTIGDGGSFHRFDKSFYVVWLIDQPHIGENQVVLYKDKEDNIYVRMQNANDGSISVDQASGCNIL